MTNQPLNVAKTSIFQEMGVFITIWLGQMVSRLGSGLTSFAFDIWVYQHTGSLTQFALLTFATTLPGVCVAPLAGSIIDRWSRRWIMVISALCSGICVLSVGIFFTLGRLEIWQIYLAVAGKSIATAFGVTAFRASIILMVPKNRLGRASGLTQATDSMARLVSPALGGILLGILQLQGVIFLDFITFILAIIPLIILDVPELPNTDHKDIHGQDKSLLSEIIEGWNYLLAQQGILMLILLRAIYNAAVGSALMLVTPLLLSLTSPANLGPLLSLAGSGMLLGSILLGFLGDRQENLVNVVFIGILVGCCCLITGGIRPSFILFTISGFWLAFGIPFINGCTQILLQRKVDPQIQGRIFSINNMAATSFPPLLSIAIGPLVDKVLEPLMGFNGPWAQGIGQLIGSGPGRGISLLFILIGLITLLFTLIAYQYEPLRRLENEVPDQVDFSRENQVA